MGPLGMASSVAGGLPQVGNADAERVQKQAADQARQAQTDQKAEAAAGVGETEQDQETSDRDADGRRLWEGSQRDDDSGDETSADTNPDATGSRPRSKDPTGMSGGNLDLSG